MSTLTVATWNIQAIRGASDDKVKRIASALERHMPDVVLLQEVSTEGDLPQRLSAALKGLFLRFSVVSPATEIRRADGRRKAYASAVFSRWPAEPLPWTEVFPWPQLVASARLTVPGAGLTAVSVHAPNGSGNGWDKVRTLEALHAGLATLDGPVVVGGDFNEPRTFEPFLESFRALPGGATEGVWTDKFGETDSRARWQLAVEQIMGPADARPPGAWVGEFATRATGTGIEATHVVSGNKPRCFDHILVSPPVVPTRVDYDHAVRLGDGACSDHSIVLAEVESTAVASERTDLVGAVDTPNGRISWTDGPLTDGTRVFLDRSIDGRRVTRELLLGSMIAHTNGALIRYLP